MFRWWSLLIVMGLLLAAGSSLMAEKAKDEEKAEKKDKDRTGQIVGKIVKVDAKSMTVEPMGGGDAVKVEFVANAQVKIDGKNAEISDLKPGMYVKVPRNPARKVFATTRAPKGDGDQGADKAGDKKDKDKAEH